MRKAFADTSKKAVGRPRVSRFLKLLEENGGNESPISYPNDFFLNAGTVFHSLRLSAAGSLRLDGGVPNRPLWDCTQLATMTCAQCRTSQP